MTTHRLPIGRRLLPSLVQEYAQFEPEKVLAIIPTDDSMTTWHELTYSELLTAVDAMAWFIDNAIGRSDSFETLGYMGLNDIRYTVFWLAAMKCGFCILNSSPRNSIEGQVSLLKDTNCNKFFCSRELQPKAAEISTAAVDSNLRIITIPEYSELVSLSGPKNPYPFKKTFEELADKPAMIFHTSGSTGLPKPISLSHRWFTSHDTLNIIPVPEGRVQANWCAMKSGEKFFNAFPSFHIGGCTLGMTAPIYRGTTYVAQSPTVPLCEDALLKICKAFDLIMAFLPPSFLEDLSNSPRAFEALSKLKYVCYGGGPLSKPAGDRLNKVISLMQMMGSTEMGTLPLLVINQWRYLEWNQNYGFLMDRVDDSDLYELVIRKDTKLAIYQAIFHLFPDISEWRTNDLYAHDVNEPDLWCFVGRKDDVIVFSNGEKFNPLDMQGHIQDHPLLKGTIVVGQGRTQVGVIVEPDEKVWDWGRDPKELIDEVWPHVETASNFSASTARVFKNRITVTKKEKPFRRSGKGTILRQPTIEDYQSEIEELYANKEEHFAQKLPQEINSESMKEFLRICLATLHVAQDKLENDQDFFAFGMDSLQTVGLVNLLNASIESAPSQNDSTKHKAAAKVLPSMIYSHANIDSLASFLTQVLDAANVRNGDGTGQDQLHLTMDRLVEKHTSHMLAKRNELVPSVQNDGLHVILTGSTGSLGSYLLNRLCSDPNIARVYCLNRGADGSKRTLESLKEKHMPSPEESKVEYLHAKFGDHRFGLGDAKYVQLARVTNLVIHNAWAVNFNFSLESFENPHIKGVRNFVDFSLDSFHRAHIFFISSIGSIGAWKGENGALVPEIPMLDASSVVPGGYGESKYAAERILVTAAEAGTPSTIARVGQIAGPTAKNGRWPDAEWLPSIIKTSKTIGKIPRSLGGFCTDAIDWIPVDLLAISIVELALNRVVISRQKHKPLDVFHLINHQTSEWKDLLPVIQEHFQEQQVQMDIVSYDEWIDTVASRGGKDPTVEIIKSMPVLVLLEFFRDMGHVDGPSKPDTANARAHSTSFDGAKPVDAVLMKNWLNQWGY